MAFAVPASGPRARPNTVTLAVYALYAAAAIELINVILALAYGSALAEGAKNALAGTSQSGGVGAGVSTGVTVVVGALLIALFVVLAVFVGKGAQVGRILTWVLGGIALCCVGGGFTFTLLGGAAWDSQRKQNPSLPTWDRYNELLYSEVPGWYRPVTTILGVLLLLAVLAAIVLLALPPSHPYFRKAQAQWEPPVPGASGYPTQPPSPGYPTQPPAPGQPGYPPADPGQQPPV